MLMFSALMASRACGADGVFVEYGRANMVEMSRVGELWKWDRNWRNDGDWQVTGFWEASLGSWRGFRPNDNNQTITEIGITPVFHFVPNAFSDWGGTEPYLEVGLAGVHLISPAFIYTDRKFGSAFQFGNHVGFGVSLGARRQFGLGYRFQHISNGDIKQPNQGINFSQLHLNFIF
ncbi:MAG: acyloxyacyl hydrolase [Nitrosomonadales bacterium]|nr:acyloxyacyl hydrolase [Nitrosomonadales bacterium]